MIVKFLPNQKGGSVASIDYLLNERKEQGTARVLKGDEKITRDLINSLSFKQKVTVGVLSFEEENITQEQKEQIIKEFEYTLAPGMKNRLNFLWVEHTDKGRLELNFVIPKIDLESGKAYDTFYYKKDTKRIDIWKDSVNLRYDFTNPKEPKKERNVTNDKTQKDTNVKFKNFDKRLKSDILKFGIKNRDELIEHIQNYYYKVEVTRQGKDYISVKQEGDKKAKRFKGGIYSQDFTSLEYIKKLELEKELKENEFIKNTVENKEATLKELQKKLYTEKKKRFIFNRKRYGTKSITLENALNELLRADKQKQIQRRERENGRARELNTELTGRIRQEERDNSEQEQFNTRVRTEQERANTELTERINRERENNTRANNFVQKIRRIAERIREIKTRVKDFLLNKSIKQNHERTKELDREFESLGISLDTPKPTNPILERLGQRLQNTKKENIQKSKTKKRDRSR